LAVAARNLPLPLTLTSISRCATRTSLPLTVTACCAIVSGDVDGGARRNRVDTSVITGCNNRMQVKPMTAAYAADIATWRYPPPYDCYDMTRVDPASLACADSGFVALTDACGLVGFRSFGSDGQVPGGTYDGSALDTGGGLRPELTGKGLGRPAIQAGLAFGRARFSPPAFRVTVAAFNLRALRVIQDLGFAEVGRFEATTTGRRYVCWYGPNQNDGQDHDLGWAGSVPPTAAGPVPTVAR
jgi:ribosomal-protein-alanine N-acetyltransferase